MEKLFTFTADAGFVVAFSLGLLIVCLIGKLIKLPIQLFVKFATNSMFGALMLGILNIFGLGVQITIIKALLAGIFGVPGVIAIYIWDNFL